MGRFFWLDSSVVQAQRNFFFSFLFLIFLKISCSFSGEVKQFKMICFLYKRYPLNDHFRIFGKRFFTEYASFLCFHIILRPYFCIWCLIIWLFFVRLSMNLENDEGRVQKWERQILMESKNTSHIILEYNMGRIFQSNSLNLLWDNPYLSDIKWL